MLRTRILLASGSRSAKLRSLSGLQKRNIVQLHYSPEVQNAKDNGIPIVALESTIISHGMPYPQNLAVAKELEAIVRSRGAVPATIAIIDGQPCIGLTPAQLETLARDAKTVTKASTRDLAFTIAAKRHGATTVASTMRFAHLAGISVFATGGLGGVHRGAERTMDISTDLVELGRTPVAVVCAGIKSILDVPKSLEVLETQGVPVVGFGTDYFPAFFTNESGLKVHARCDNVQNAAQLVHVQQQICPNVGCVIAVPNPKPADGQVITQAINVALEEADANGIHGNAITPFLLARVEQLTGGKSLNSNIALVKNNVAIAADIAVQLQLLKGQATPASQQQNVLVDSNLNSKESNGAVDASNNNSNNNSSNSSSSSVSDQVLSTDSQSPSSSPLIIDSASQPAVREVPSSTSPSSSSTSSKAIDVLVIGGATVDIIASLPAHANFYPGSSNPGMVRQSFGGVGRNVAANIAAHGPSTALLTAVVDDAPGNALLRHAAHQCQLITDHVLKLPPKTAAASQSSSSTSSSSVSRELRSDQQQQEQQQQHNYNHNHPHSYYRTAVYNAVHDSTGELIVGVADMDVFSAIDAAYIAQHESRLIDAKIVLLDGNLSAETFETVANAADALNRPLFFEPTSDHKCTLPLSARSLHLVNVMKPNRSELIRILTRVVSSSDSYVQRLAAKAELTSHIDWNLVRGELRWLQEFDKNAAKDQSFAADAKMRAAELGILKLLSGVLWTLMQPWSPPPSSSSSSSSSSSRLRSERHLLLSLGSRGVLWTASTEHLAPLLDEVARAQLPWTASLDPTGRRLLETHFSLQDRSVSLLFAPTALYGHPLYRTLVQGTALEEEAATTAARPLLAQCRCGSVLVQARKIHPDAVVHSNGAGDAFFGRFIAEHLATADMPSATALSAVLCGLDSAELRLTGKETSQIH